MENSQTLVVLVAIVAVVGISSLIIAVQKQKVSYPVVEVSVSDGDTPVVGEAFKTAGGESGVTGKDEQNIVNALIAAPDIAAAETKNILEEINSQAREQGYTYSLTPQNLMGTESSTTLAGD